MRGDSGFTSKNNVIFKGSEWNRLILPLIDPPVDDATIEYKKGINGRYGPRTKGLVEKNMPTLANYSWWADFGGGNKGSERWTQEKVYSLVQYRTNRGNDTINDAAASTRKPSPKYSSFSTGWLPVCERVE